MTSWQARLARAGPPLLQTRLGARWLQWQHAAAAHPTVLDWNWRGVGYSRIAIVNLLVAATRGWDTRYLEIGCAGDTLFHAVAARHKTGVDPEQGGTVRATSDAFFATNTESFDVIFIDGLHDCRQVRRDVLNALGCLAPGGWIAMHDLLPGSWREQHLPRLQEAWTGDCWKTAVELAAASGVQFHVVRADYGVGLLRKVGGEVVVPDLSPELAHAGFGVFLERLPSLPLVSVEEAVALIRSA